MLILGVVVASCQDFDHGYTGPSGVSGSSGTAGSSGAGARVDAGASGSSSDGGDATSAGDGGSDARPEPPASSSGDSGRGGGTGGVLGSNGGVGSGGAAMAGEAGSGGGGHAGSRPTGGGDEVPNPWCASSPAGHPAVSPFLRVGDVAAAYLVRGVTPVAFATQEEIHIVAVSWRLAPEPSGTWIPWSCLDQVVAPARLASRNRGDTLFVYSATAAGRLYVRWLSWNTPWTPWSAISTPISAVVSDIATANVPASSTLYAASAGAVYVRSQMLVETNEVFTNWRSLGSVGAVRLAVDALADGTERVLTLDADGALRAGIHDPLAPQAPVTWQELTSTPSLVDLTFVGSDGGSSELLGVDVNGRLWITSALGPLNWREVDVDESTPALTSIASAGVSATAPEAFAVDDQGRVLASAAPWAEWRLVP